MARIPSLFLSTLLLLEITDVFACAKAQAAFYDSKTYFMSVLGAHDALQPTALNGALAADAPLLSLLSIRVRAERGLIAPELTHWMEFGFGFSSAFGQGEISGFGFQSLSQSLTQFVVIPAGVTWWVVRSSFVDLGPSLGLGMVFAANHSQVLTSPDTGSTETLVKQSAGIGPAIDLLLHARLWFSKYFGADVAGGLRYVGATFDGTQGKTWANLLGYNVTFGATFAFGGVRGTGRAQVEVIRAAKEPPKGSTR